MVGTEEGNYEGFLQALQEIHKIIVESGISGHMKNESSRVVDWFTKLEDRRKTTGQLYLRI